MTYKLNRVLLVSLSILVLPFIAQAAVLGVGGAECTDATDQILGIIDRIIGWTVGLVLVLAVPVIIYSAFLILTAGGSEDKVATARKYIVYSAVAVAVALLSMLFVDLIIELVTGGSAEDLIAC